jgi:DNA-binding NarL/FixJ family response regulator
MTTRLFIYDDNPDRIDSLKSLFLLNEDLQVVGAASDCVHVLTDMESTQPNIVLMDINMPNVDGIAGLKSIKSKYPHIKVLMQTAFDDSDKIFSAIKNGANGYILKKDKPQRILQAIDEVSQGGAAINPAIAQKLLDYFAPSNVVNPLSPKEQEVLKYLAQGMSYKMVADKLGISYTTVNTHGKRIYEKLHISSLGEAIAWYYNHQQ